MSDRPNLYLISRKLKSTTIALAMLGTTHKVSGLQGAIAEAVQLLRQAQSDRPDFAQISRDLKTVTEDLSTIGEAVTGLALKGAIAHSIRLIQSAQTELTILNQLQEAKQ